MTDIRVIRVLFSCGGTGGHIYPAVSIARAIQSKLPNVEILFVGANGKMEMQKVPKEGFEIKGLTIAGFQRGFNWNSISKNLLLPFKLIFSFFQTFWILYKFRPDVAIGTGGYASGPTLKMAQWMDIPTFIQEQNALPGYTNRILGQKAKAIFVSFDQMEAYFSNKNIFNFGNAIREDFSSDLKSKSEALQYFNFDQNKKTVFITGGSLGARPINQALSNQLNLLIENNIQVIWQCGANYLEQYKVYESPLVKVFGFIENIHMAYAAADILVTRAGGAIFEMFVIGKPIIVLPSPYVAEDHQTVNAKALENQKAAIMIKDQEANEKLVSTIISLLHNAELQLEMQQKLKSLAKPNAASQIAEYVISFLNNKNTDNGRY